MIELDNKFYADGSIYHKCSTEFVYRLIKETWSSGVIDLKSFNLQEDEELYLDTYEEYGSANIKWYARRKPTEEELVIVNTYNDKLNKQQTERLRKNYEELKKRFEGNI